MEYEIISIPESSSISQVAVSIQMSGRDWYAVENSQQWKALQEFVDGLQTEQDR